MARRVQEWRRALVRKVPSRRSLHNNLVLNHRGEGVRLLHSHLFQAETFYRSGAGPEARGRDRSWDWRWRGGEAFGRLASRCRAARRRSCRALICPLPQKETTLHESRDALVRAVLAPCSLDLRADRPDRRDNLSTDLRLPDRPPRATRPVLLFLPGQWAERQAPLGHSDADERQPTGDRPACPQASVTSKPPGGGGSAAPAAPRARAVRCSG